jgi:hypothetical protein
MWNKQKKKICFNIIYTQNETLITPEIQAPQSSSPIGKTPIRKTPIRQASLDQASLDQASLSQASLQVKEIVSSQTCEITL